MLGKSAEFKMFVDVEDGERVPIKYVILEFKKGGETVQCVFNPDGTKYNEVDEHFGECTGVTLKKIDTPDKTRGFLHGLDQSNGTDYTFGYGSGFGEGTQLHYKVRINTKKGFFKRSGFRTGEYEVVLKAYAKNKKDHKLYEHTYPSEKQMFNVTYPCKTVKVDKKTCSIDAFSPETLSAIADLDKTHNCVLSKKEAKSLGIDGCIDSHGKDGNNDDESDDDEDEEDQDDDANEDDE